MKSALIIGFLEDEVEMSRVVRKDESVRRCPERGELIIVEAGD